MNPLISSFNECYEIVRADTDELIQHAFRIRYQVMSVEEQVPDFESEKYTNGLERDHYDERRSVQSLLRFRPTGDYIGTVRLILSDPEQPEQPFPVEEAAGEYFDSEVVQPSCLPRRQTAEISRLVVAREFRNGPETAGLPTPGQRYTGNPGIIHKPFLGLLVAIMRMTVERGITHWYAGMEQPLHIRLASFGLKLTPIGPPVQYHGTRRPYLGTVEQMMHGVYHKRRQVWELLTDAGNLYPPPASVPEVRDARS
jgi:N-acyl amino acid synthase of PEP-CTERM/exosortase system